MCCVSKPRTPIAPPVFGVPLADSHRSVEYQYVPKIVVKCVEFIEQKENIATMGIYHTNVDEFSLFDLKKKVRFSWIMNFIWHLIELSFQ